jgi:hypothetical protein
MAAIAHVFTISYVANLLGEDEDWLLELSTDMFLEDGCLWVYGVGEDGAPAFTKDGIENLRQIVAEQRCWTRTTPGQTRQIAPPAVLTGCSPRKDTEYEQDRRGQASADRLGINILAG